MNAPSSGSDSRSAYEEIMSQGLGHRLVEFRKWLSSEANVTLHPSVCIVNGEATDGTKNAPVLLFGPPPITGVGGSGGDSGGGATGSGRVATLSSGVGTGGTASAAAFGGRCGIIDSETDQALYDRTMGCQIRAAREIKKEEIMMTIPRSSMITPDLVASSDAGRAVLACIRPGKQQQGVTPNFWDAFGNTTLQERKYAEKLSSGQGAQLLIKILQERKKVERIMADVSKPKQWEEQVEQKFTLADMGTIATRAPIMAFLIHQRFFGDSSPQVKSKSVTSFGRDIATKDEPDASDLVLLPDPPKNSPKTYGPYARTLPSYVSLPICWKRNELAPLSNCIVGTGPMQDVAAKTMQLSADLVALAKAGLFQRFPDVFPPGLITWDRWVWAAAILASRNLPASTYLDQQDSRPADHQPLPGEMFYSPPDIWGELGVLVPFLDMCNHEVETNQITWESPLGSHSTIGAPANVGSDWNVAKAVMHKRVKKGCQIYTNYGHQKNGNLIGSYGFAQINNPSDEVRIGWGLCDGIGSVPPPEGYDISLELEGVEGNIDIDKQYLVYEAPGDEGAIQRWWTEDRLALLKKEAGVRDDRFMANLKAGKKMNAKARCDGSFDIIFLAAAVVATMPPEEVRRQTPILLSPEGKNSSIALTKQHQCALRRYLVFFLSQKLEKLLQNLNKGLKAHFNNIELWTKASQGGLHYTGLQQSEGGDKSGAVGWQTFFDTFAYATSMEVEKRYYAMGSDSCVLALYDGSLRCLQISIDGVKSLESFSKDLLKQLEDVNMNVAKDETDEIPRKATSGDVPRKVPNTTHSASANGGLDHSTASAVSRMELAGKQEKTPAVKLHVGNLSYQTSPAELFKYFSSLYGRDNVLECHIPTERDCARSRGFGFVTMPKEVAAVALDPSRKHEIGDRLLKVAESNTAGSGRNPSGAPKGQISSDRCVTCGYRPKYCACSSPNVPGGAFSGGGGGTFETGSHHSGSHAGSRPPDEIYGPPLGSMNDHGISYYDRSLGDYDYGLSSKRRSRSRSPRRRNRSRSPRRSDRDRDHYYDEYRRRSHSRSRSRDRCRDLDRHDRRDRDRDRNRDRRRSRSRSRDRGRADSTTGSRRDRDRDEKRARKRRHRSRSRSRERRKRSKGKQDTRD